MQVLKGLIDMGLGDLVGIGEIFLKKDRILFQKTKFNPI